MTWSSRAIGVALGLAAVVATAPRPALHDAITPVLIRPVASSVAPVQGDDGRYHIVYELWLANAKAVPATIERIEVLDAGDHSRVLKDLSGDGLATAFFRLTAQPAAATTLAPDKSRILFIELGFDRRSASPSTGCGWTTRVVSWWGTRTWSRTGSVTTSRSSRSPAAS